MFQVILLFIALFIRRPMSIFPKINVFTLPALPTTCLKTKNVSSKNTLFNPFATKVLYVQR